MGFRWILLIMLVWVAMSACSGKQQTCTDFNSSSTVLAQTLAQLAGVLEQTPDSAQALVKVKAILDEKNAALEPCMQIVGKTIQTLNSEQILNIHEKFIADPRVRRFLDAQDKFQESATPDQIEQLDELVTQLYITAE